MTITRKILTAAIAAGLSLGATGAVFAGQKYPGQPKNFSKYAAPAPHVHKKQKNLPAGVRCQPGFYGVADCNVSRNGRTFGPEGYDYATETGQHIGR